MIHCPYCNHEMNLKGARPGRFTPACAMCHQKFSLVVPEDPGAQAIAVALTEGKKVAAAAQRAAGQVTAAHASAHPARPPSSQMATAASPAPVAKPIASKAMNVTAPPGPASPAALSSGNVDVPLTPKPRVSVAGHKPEPVSEELPLSGTLGGYELVQKLGQGGMGAVYLARQVSLDRNVAVKVLRENLSRDPRFVSRFTKEAYAAAQLTHHNVVQIHDIGEQRDKHFFSMEFVEGETLAGLVEREGKLDPEVAVGYVLQAARGLKFAHDHGMVHRDVKPENLLLNAHGIVKVADLGLVKRAKTTTTTTDDNAGSATDASRTAKPGANAGQTLADYAMGTPAYMPPEQASDAANVDLRADIYSLGCTLYDLVTGRPPFVGKTVEEVLTKHAREPIVPPNVVDKHIPKSLSDILLKMTAKRREDRFQNMESVIKSLEEYLGVTTAGPFSPRAEDVRLLELSVEKFNGTKWARLRGKLILGFYAFCALMVVLMALFKSDPTAKLQWAGAFVGLAVLTTLSYVVLTGVTQGTFVFRKLRQLVFGARLVDWLTWIVGLAIVGGLLYAFDQHVGWLVVLIVAFGLAAAFHFSIDLLMKKDRKDWLVRIEGMLKTMRVKGLDEDALRQFVCKYSGQRWEEFYESLFGYEAKMQARQRWGVGERGKDRKKWAAWRDPLIAWIDAKQKSRKERKEHRHLAKLEARRLKAEGVGEREAKKKADRAAETMVERAATFKETSAKRAAMTVGPTIAKSAPAIDLEAVRVPSPPSLVLEDAGGADGIEGRREGYLRRKYGGLSGLIVGKQLRFVLGAILLGGFALWLYQNKSVPAVESAVNAARTINAAHDQLSNESNYKEADKIKDVKYVPPKSPLRIKLVPSFITNLFSNYNAGLAGGLLILSCAFSGAKLGWFIVPAALFMVAGHLIPGLATVPLVQKYASTGATSGVPIVYPLTLLGGLLLAGLGLFLARK